MQIHKTWRYYLMGYQFMGILYCIVLLSLATYAGNFLQPKNWRKHPRIDIIHRHWLLSLECPKRSKNWLNLFRICSRCLELADTRIWWILRAIKLSYQCWWSQLPRSIAFGDNRAFPQSKHLILPHFYGFLMLDIPFLHEAVIQWERSHWMQLREKMCALLG